MLDFLKNFDHALFIGINSHHAPFWDVVMTVFSNRMVWIPFYALLAYTVSRKIPTTHFFVLLVCVGFLILVSDQLSVLAFKNQFHRLRPCYSLFKGYAIHLVGGCGGTYGFISSHASNVGAITCFLLYAFNTSVSWFKFVLIPWMILVGYSRIYLGVHYPADVAVGALFGGGLGIAFAFIYQQLTNRFFSQSNA